MASWKIPKRNSGLSGTIIYIYIYTCISIFPSFSIAMFHCGKIMGIQGIAQGIITSQQSYGVIVQPTILGWDIIGELYKA